MLSSVMSEANQKVTVRDGILTAGIALLREHGVTALTQPKVAAVAGVKQSHLTYYFPKRVDLLLGVAEYAIDNILNDLEAGLANNPAQPAFVNTITTAMINGIPPRVMLGLIVAADADPEIRPALQTLVRRVRQHIQLMLAKAGMAADDTSTLIFHAVIVGLAVMHDAQRTDESAQEVKAGIDAVIRLMGAKI